MARHRHQESFNSGSERFTKRQKIIAATGAVVTAATLVGAAYLSSSKEDAPAAAPIETEQVSPEIAAQQASRGLALDMTHKVSRLIEADTPGARVEAGPDGIEKIGTTQDGKPFSLYIGRNKASNEVNVEANMSYSSDPDSLPSGVRATYVVSESHEAMQGDLELKEVAGITELADIDPTIITVLQAGDEQRISYDGRNLGYSNTTTAEDRLLGVGDVANMGRYADDYLATVAQELSR